MGGFLSSLRRTSEAEVRKKLDNPRERMVFRQTPPMRSHLERLIKIIGAMKIKKLVFEDCFRCAIETLEVLQVLINNREIEDLYLSLSRNQYDEDCVAILAEMIETGRIKSLALPYAVNATHVTRILRAVKNRKSEMDILDLEDCELDADGLDLLEDIVDAKKIKRRLNLRHCRSADEERSLLLEGDTEALMNKIKKVQPVRIPFDLFVTIKLFKRRREHRTSRRSQNAPPTFGDRSQEADHCRPSHDDTAYRVLRSQGIVVQNTTVVNGNTHNTGMANHGHIGNLSHQGSNNVGRNREGQCFREEDGAPLINAAYADENVYLSAEESIGSDTE